MAQWLVYSWMIWDSVSGGVQDFSHFHSSQKSSEVHTTCYSKGSVVMFPAVKWPGCAVDYSSPTSVEVKNEWNHTSSHPISLHGMERVLLDTLGSSPKHSLGKHSTWFRFDN
jgi:hypothetical protein